LLRGESLGKYDQNVEQRPVVTLDIPLNDTVGVLGEAHIDDELKYIMNNKKHGRRW
jgi:hypothetical protein